MKKEILSVPVNGVDFYCEKMGSGPSIVLVPDGCNDCGPYVKLMEYLSNEFTVVTFDMRGGTRSKDTAPQKVTPKRLADDVAGIVKSLDLAPVSAYGCSSGGQTVLSLGKYYPELCRNIMVHEAALQSDTPLPDAGFKFFERMDNIIDKLKLDPTAAGIWAFGDYYAYMALGEECHHRMDENAKFWAQYYRGTVDRDSYTQEDFENMPPVDFTVGVYTAAWLTQANIVTASRGNCSVTWLYSEHHPETTSTQELGEHIRQTVKKYL